jgi:hypothetical protein
MEQELELSAVIGFQGKPVVPDANNHDFTRQT